MKFLLGRAKGGISRLLSFDPAVDRRQKQEEREHALLFGKTVKKRRHRARRNKIVKVTKKQHWRPLVFHSWSEFLLNGNLAQKVLSRGHAGLVMHYFAEPLLVLRAIFDEVFFSAATPEERLVEGTPVYAAIKAEQLLKSGRLEIMVVNARVLEGRSSK